MHRLHSHLSRTLDRHSRNELIAKVLPSCSACSFSSSATKYSEPAKVPSQARVVIAGGGVVGASVAYHLAERGWTDVTVLEQGQLTCGTTWHSVGLIGRLRPSRTDFQLLDYSAKLYDKLEKEGHGLGWKQCGSLNMARTKDRMVDIKRKHAVAQSLGIETHLVTPKEAKDICPIINSDDLEGAIWVPHDGSVTAPDVTMALARIAKEKGVKIIEGVEVENVLTDRKRVTEVQTSSGNIKCEYFVNCGGQWARDLGKKTTPSSVDVPLHSCEHYYMVTKPIEGIDRMMPVLRDYDGHTYYREWNGGLLAGGFEPNPIPCFHKGIPKKFEFGQLPEDWDHFQILLDNILQRIPLMETAEVRQLFNGPESFTPDGKWLLGKAPQLQNYFIAAGMSSTGIVGAGGTGKHIADWIIDDKTSVNLWMFDVQRFGPLHNNKTFLKDRMRESLANMYLMKYPREEFWTGRKLRCSPIHAKLELQGAVFGETMAYERAIYFSNPHDDTSICADEGPMWTWRKPCWFRPVQEEYWACKERVCVMDMSSFTKIEVKSQGDEATQFLQYLCSSNIAKDIGTITHTGMQNEDGGFENDCTVARLDENHYVITCLSNLHTRAFAWLNKHLPSDGSLQVSDVTSMFSGINIIGPHAQQLLQDVCSPTFSTEKKNFRPMTVNVIDVGQASGIRAMRLTHTGEDGFILYIPSESALHVYDTLMMAGKDYGIRNAGYYALRHLRIEKVIPYWGLDLDDKTTPLECGRGFKSVLDDKKDFLGKEALLKQQEVGVKRRFTQFLLEDFDVHEDIWPWGGEPIYRDGKFVGMTTTCGYGYSLNKMVCLGFIGEMDDSGQLKAQTNINEWVLDRNAKYEIEIAGVRYPIKAGIYAPNLNI